MSEIISCLIIFCCLVAQTCLTLCDPMDCSTPDFPVLYHLPEFAQTHVHLVGDTIQPFCPLLPPSPPPLDLSQHQGLFWWVALHITWPKYWCFGISPSDESSGLISFRINWFDLLADHGTPKSLLQHYSSKASIFECLGFFMVHLSHLYMTTEKTMDWLSRHFLAKCYFCFLICCLGLS